MIAVAANLGLSMWMLMNDLFDQVCQSLRQNWIQVLLNCEEFFTACPAESFGQQL